MTSRIMAWLTALASCFAPAIALADWCDTGPSFAGCQMPATANCTDPTDIEACYAELLAATPLSGFDSAAGSAAGHFIIPAHELFAWPGCVTPPAGYTAPTCADDFSPFAGCPITTEPHPPHTAHPYRGDPAGGSTPGDGGAHQYLEHGGAHINFDKSMVGAAGLAVWWVDIQAPVPGRIRFAGPAGSQAPCNNASGDAANLFIEFANNDRDFDNDGTPEPGAWRLQLSLEPQAANVGCRRTVATSYGGTDFLAGSWVNGAATCADPTQACPAEPSGGFLEILVADGDCVAPGDVIARMPVRADATGGPHVHFNIKSMNNPAVQDAFYCPNIFTDGIAATFRSLWRGNSLNAGNDPCPADSCPDGVPYCSCPATFAAGSPPQGASVEDPALCYDYGDYAETRFSNAQPADNLFPNNR